MTFLSIYLFESGSKLVQIWDRSFWYVFKGEPIYSQAIPMVSLILESHNIIFELYICQETVTLLICLCRIQCMQQRISLTLISNRKCLHQYKTIERSSRSWWCLSHHFNIQLWLKLNLKPLTNLYSLDAVGSFFMWDTYFV